jgi:hypothetical protein
VPPPEPEQDHPGPGSCHRSAASRPQLYPAPTPHGDPQLTGLRGWVGRRPLTGFLVIALGLSWLLFAIPVLAFHGIIPGANLPVEVFALGSTLLNYCQRLCGSPRSPTDGWPAGAAFTGFSLAVRHWLVASGAVRSAGDRPVARPDLRRLVAHSRSRASLPPLY